MIEAARQLELGSIGIKGIEVGDNKDFFIGVADNAIKAREIRTIIQGLNGQYPLEQFAINGRIYIVETNQLKVYKEPQPSRSLGSEIPGRGSQALYCFRSKYISPAVQGYSLEEGEECSYHGHEEHWEKLIKAAGQANLILDDVKQPFDKDVMLNTGIKHMVEAGPSGAFVVCITYGPGDCFEMDDHHYQPKPQFT